MRKVVPVVLAAMLVAAPARATKYAGEFMKLPVGPRAVGMGGAFTAVCDDATAPFWNPAGMVFLPYREAFFQHVEQFGSLANDDNLSAVFPLGGTSGKQAALGVSLVRVAVDDIPITPRPGGLRPGIDFLDYGLDGDPTTPDPGQGDGIWEPGERLLLNGSDFFMASSSQMAGSVSYARHEGPHWTFGGSVKFVRQSLPDTIPGGHVTSFGAGLDAGLIYMPSDAITIGAMMRDLTTTYLAWSNGTREIVVPTLSTGAAFNFYPGPRHALTLAEDIGWGFEDRTNDAQMSFGSVTLDFRTGLEYWYRSTLALRAGVNNKDLTFGAGLRYKQIGFDYAASLNRFFASNDPSFPDDQNLDVTHLVSLAYNW